MYYFDDRTGEYKQRRAMSMRSILISTLIIAFFSALVYKQKEKESIQIKNLKEENTKLINALNVIDEELTRNRKLLDNIKQLDQTIYRSILMPDDNQDSNFRIKKIATPVYHIELETDNDAISNVKDSLEDLNLEMIKQENVFKQLQKAAIRKKNILASVPAIFPVRSRRLTSGYGMRVHPIYKTLRMHNGFDFADKIDTDVIATGDGIVREVNSNRSSGLFIKIDHGYGYTTVYAHLNSTNVHIGMRVKRGQIIGKMGNTGISTGSHLHYEIRKNGRSINPITYCPIDMTPKEFDEIVKINNSNTMSLD